MTDGRDATIGAAIGRLIEVASGDPILRAGLRAIAVEVLARLDADIPAETPVDAPAAAVADGPTEPSVQEPVPEPPAARPDVVPMEPAAFLALLDAVQSATPATPAAAPSPAPPPAAQEPDDPGRPSRDAQLPGLRDRARAKAVLTRALAEARESGEALDEAVVHRARSVGATTWMTSLPDPDPAELALLAGAFDAVADVTDLILHLHAEHPVPVDDLASAVKTLAAVQSALRITTSRLRGMADEDQGVAFAWLRETTAQERIFVERHMRLDDPLDPGLVEAVMAEPRERLELLREEDRRREGRERGLKQVRYHADLLARGKGSDHDRGKVVSVTADLVQDGLPPSNLQLRGMLLPIVGQLRQVESPPSSFGLVLRELERYERERASMTADEAGQPAVAAPSEEVRAVADLLRGTELVLVGGERRPEAGQAISDAFGLSGLHWHTLSDDLTMTELERTIGRPEVSTVVQLVRWSRHRHGDARAFAEQHGKPFVRVTGGYNPNAVARAILGQASERLASRAR